MNIALLTSWPLDVTIGSGVVRMVQGMRQGLEELGATVRVFHSGFYPKSLLNLAVERLRFNRRLGSFSWDAFDAVLGFDFDGFRIGDRYNAKYFVYNGGTLKDILPFERGKTKTILECLSYREKQAMEKARLVFAPSDYSMDKISELYQIPRTKVRRLPLGLTPEEWDSLPRAAESTRKPIILCVAKQYARKGIPDLIRAFKTVSRRLPDADLQVVGDGPTGAQNRALVKRLGLERRVHFASDVANRDRLSAFYRQARVFCLPSYHETFGLVFLEAMLHRLPVVAYRATAVPEVVAPQAGALCPPGDVNCLSRQLIHFLTDREANRKAGNAGRKQALAFTWQRSAALFVENLKAVGVL